MFIYKFDRFSVGSLLPGRRRRQHGRVAAGQGREGAHGHQGALRDAPQDGGELRDRGHDHDGSAEEGADKVRM